VVRGFVIVLVLGGAAAPLGWFGSDWLERNDEFCVACHLSENVPLHEAKLEEFRADPAANLVAAHRAAEEGLGCIDCHGGASFVNKLRVKTVAARDAAKWLIGSFDEPDHMKHPLWDEDCRQCHRTYAPAREDDFHALADHNVVDFDHRCVGCHRAHPTQGVSADLDFLDQDVVLPICRNCHEEF
jgi:hypothetical protein